MHALIVTSHPEYKSLTNSIAFKIGEGLSQSGSHTFEIADLAAEGFDPRFSQADIASHKRRAETPPDVAAEQARIDRADSLVLVFPVYWWSMPGLLKGWIDRVFSNGWAYDDNFEGKLSKKLGHLQIHLVGIGGADARTYEKHGYDIAMERQIDHGIFDYCGARVISSTRLLEADSRDPLQHFNTARNIGASLFDKHMQVKPTVAA